MKQLVAARVVDIPDDVEFEVKARTVRVKGPRGEMLAVLLTWVVRRAVNTGGDILGHS